MEFEYKCLNCGNREPRNISPLKTHDGADCPECNTEMNTVRE